ncbi:MAG: ATP-binding protein [Desulfovibrionaceae bacterium]
MKAVSFSRSIFGKALLATVAATFAIVCLWTYYAIRTESEQLKRNTISTAEHVSEFIAASVQSAFWSLNWIYVDEMLNETVRFMDKQLLYALVVKDNGEVYLASDDSYQGELIDTSLLTTVPRLVDNYFSSKHGVTGMVLTKPVVIGNKNWHIILGLSLEPVTDATRTLFRRQMMWALGLLGIGSTFALFFSRSISKPINKLVEAVQQIAPDNLTLDVAISSRDEVGVLHDSFRWMLGDLDKAQRRLEADAHVNASIAELSKAAITLPTIVEITSLMLDHARALTGSPQGYAGYFSPDSGKFICPALCTGENACHVSYQAKPVSDAFLCLWGATLTADRTILREEPPAEEGGAAGLLSRFVCSPSRLGEKLLGSIGVAEASRPYSEWDRSVMERLSALYAIVLQRHQALDALRQAEGMYRSIFEEAMEGIYRCTLDGRYLRVNPAMARLCGYASPEDMLDRGNDIVGQLYVSPERRAEFFYQLEEYGRVREFEFEARLPDGSLRFLSTSCQRISDGNGHWYLEGLATDITARKLKEKAEVEREAALSASRAKSLFLACMSHELRTPMNAVVGATEVLAETTLDKEQSELVQLLKMSSESLLVLINDILDISKIEAGKLELERTAFDLRKLVVETAELFVLRADEKHLRFSYAIAPDVPANLIGDPTRLRQVLLNLLGNAIKFTNEGSVALVVDAVKCTRTTAEVSFAVSDTGIGIAPANMNRMFETFCQADASITRSFGGTGLGLAISKAFVEMMGGAISVKSEEGLGSTFYFTVILDVPEYDIAFGSMADVDNGAVPHSSAAVKVLLVEDTKSLRTVVSHYLRHSRFALECAENGQDGVRTFADGSFDIVLMDIEMPVMNGFEATKAIRGSGAPGRTVPIIALTGHAKPQDKERCLAAGCTGYLSKPVRKLDLLRVLEQYADPSSSSA